MYTYQIIIYYFHIHWNYLVHRKTHPCSGMKWCRFFEANVVGCEKRISRLFVLNFNPPFFSERKRKNYTFEWNEREREINSVITELHSTKLSISLCATHCVEWFSSTHFFVVYGVGTRDYKKKVFAGMNVYMLALCLLFWSFSLTWSMVCVSIANICIDHKMYNVRQPQKSTSYDAHTPHK